MSTVMASQARGQGVEDFLPSRCQDLHWQLEPEGIQGFEAQKLEALSKYESQIIMLGGIDMFERVLAHYYRFFGGAEPYWVAREPD